MTGIHLIGLAVRLPLQSPPLKWRPQGLGDWEESLSHRLDHKVGLLGEDIISRPYRDLSCEQAHPSIKLMEERSGREMSDVFS